MPENIVSICTSSRPGVDTATSPTSTIGGPVKTTAFDDVWGTLDSFLRTFVSKPAALRELFPAEVALFNRGHERVCGVDHVANVEAARLSEELVGVCRVPSVVAG